MPYNRSRQDNWWKRRTSLEKQLSYIALGSIVTALILFISLIFYHQYGVPKGVCLSSGCVHAASDILGRLDEDINPCEDFYSFACGGFIKTRTIPDDVSAYSAFTEVRENLMKQLRAILEEPEDPSDITAVQVVKSYYKACMNEEMINAEALVEAQTLMNTLGGWPVLEEVWDPNNFDWIEELKLFKEQGLDFNYLLSIKAGKDIGNSSARIITVDQPPVFGLTIHNLVKGIHDSSVRNYLELMVDFAVMFGAAEYEATADMEEALLFEIKLAKKTVSKIENRNSSQFYNKMTLKQLKQQYGTIDWMKLFQYILPEEVKLYDDREIMVEVPSYIDGLEKLLKTTAPKTVANYLFWRAALEIWPFLPQKFEDRITRYKKVTGGISQSSPRWKKCLDLTQAHLPLLLGATYVRRYSNEETKVYAAEMVDYIMTEFKKTLQYGTPWMDESTRKQALMKADKIKAQIAYANEMLDDKLLNELCAEIFVNEKAFLTSFLNINRHEWNRLLRKLLDPTARNDWTETAGPIVVNAYYHRLENTIILPAAILQGVFFNRNRPGFLNFGAIGTIVGHEIIHAFDDQGSQFDEDGNLRSWWNQDTLDAFAEKAKCFIETFNSIRVEEVDENVSGTRTLGENIADNGGAKQAYLAYQSWTDQYGSESKLPGLKYNPKQLFWIASAQNWCSKERLEYLRQKVASDTHTPDKYRVNANFQNLDVFSKDFKCPLDSRMNPRNKCSVW
ncbi:neprilysin-2-like isoform X1 [Coccinella septempunctata]|uniref:neprilysin-2-like isoform X1 n=1 Tax=Coccinella septempunctata TaxID=41139 RepID=UPI001D061410|nr:neprilysin-2-like isoform X1 [Coccinella septempunctata]